MVTWLYMMDEMNLWVVGHYNDSNQWTPEDKYYKIEKEARERASELNKKERIEEDLRSFLKSNGR